MNDDLISREEVLNLIDTAFESGAFDGRYAYENLVDAVQNLIHPLETDLVSRQAVIDTIETNCSWDIFNEWGCRTPVGESIINAIKSVSSVEPEKCKMGMSIDIPQWKSGKKWIKEHKDTDVLNTPL